ncbi:AAA family ATPase [Acinetobacter variabilis]|uniref:AAA family ATPase n=1 Tax=Acinetobacter variabilis TaxID=70346 RepID=UPI0028AB455E|nr:AAA family ATPase [Acinetobacter variabilis]
MKLNERIELILKKLSENMYEREHIIALSLLGALSGTNTFLLGSPGTAKSLISRKISQAFEQPKYFEYLMNRFSTPEEVFGPVSIKALKEDKYTRKIESYLPSADFAFLDEIWKSSPAILNALLTLLNEKLFKNGDEIVHVPLKAFVSASNEIPAENQGLDALYDRFILRLIVEPIKNNENFLNLIGSKPTEVEVNLEKNLLIQQDEWQKWQKDIHDVKFSKEVSNIILFVRKKLADLPENQKIYVSDRRWQRAAYLLKAAAFFNGRKEVILSEIFLLKYCLWNKTDDFKEIQKIIEQSLTKNGLDTGIDIESLILKNQSLEKEITNELYYTEDVYLIHTIAGKEYFRFKFDNQDIYVEANLKGTDKDFYPIDKNGNQQNYYICNFNKSGTCTVRERNYYRREEKKTPSIQFKKGTKKQEVNERLIVALDNEVSNNLNQLQQALENVHNRNETLKEKFKSLFVAEDELSFLLKNIDKQIGKLETHIKDCERLKSLCIN